VATFAAHNSVITLSQNHVALGQKKPCFAAISCDLWAGFRLDFALAKRTEFL
jgi:hypothetical protein